MTQGQGIMATIAFLLWVASPVLFFRREIRLRWRNRGLKRERLLLEAKKKADAEARYRDELAAKYPLPAAERTPESSA